MWWRLNALRAPQQNKTKNNKLKAIWKLWSHVRGPGKNQQTCYQLFDDWRQTHSCVRLCELYWKQQNEIKQDTKNNSDPSDAWTCHTHGLGLKTITIPQTIKWREHKTFTEL